MCVPDWLKAAALWCVIAAFAVLNGAFRESVLVAAVGRTPALVASGLLLCGGVCLVAWWAAPWYGRRPVRVWLSIGLFWLVLTVAFEFGLGRLVLHRTWAELSAAYRFSGGDLWPLVLLVTFGAPWAAARVRGLV